MTRISPNGAGTLDGTERLILDEAYDHEAKHRDRTYLTQPVGGGRVVEYTWGQTMDQARRMAAWLRAQGLARGDRVAILSKNCAHFFMADLAIWMAGGATVAIYPTETAATVRYVLQHSGATLMFVGKLEIWDQQRAAIPEDLRCVALPLAPQDGFETWDAIVAATPPLEGRIARGADELALIVYTSGSTGEPKGVMHSFHGVTAASRAIVRIGADVHPGGAQRRMLSYLPLAHVMERCYVEGSSIVDPGDVRVFFADSLDTFVQDLNRARPTVFISVPRLWLKFQQGVLAKTSPRLLDIGLRVPVLGRILGRRVLHGLGLDQVVMAGSGSAPVPRELIEWYLRLGLTLVEAYGMTEDFCLSHCSTVDLRAPGYVGIPMEGVQSRISESGEIEVKSPARMMGYYERPDLTAEVFTEDGYFRTGDRGEYDARGLLKLTGRVKELFKTSKGKYVAPAPIENMLTAHAVIESCMVAGAGHPAAHAVVVLAENLRPRQADPAFRAEVEPELRALLKSVNAELAEHEQLQMLVVAPEPWSIENGCLTPTLKIRRARIEAACAAQVEAWYAARSPIVWA